MIKRSTISNGSSMSRQGKAPSRRSRQVSRILALAASGMVAHLALADSSWTGSTSQDWNDGTNWSVNPPTGNFLINTTVAGVYPIISSTSAFAPVDIKIGTAGFSGRLDQTAGSLNTGNGNWLFVGQGTGGVGTYNIADTASTGGSLTGFGLGSGSLNVGGTSTTSGRITAGDGSNAVGTVNMYTSGTVKVEQDDIGILMGAGGTSVGNFNLDGGTLQVNSSSTGIALLAGTNGGDGNFRMSGGTVNATGGVWLGDNNAGSQGLVDISGGVFNVTASSAVGSSGNGQVFIGRGLGQGVFSVSGSAAVTISGAVNVGFSNTATSGTAGLLTISGGTFATTGDLRVGSAQNGNSVVAAGTGVFNLSGGTANIGGVLQLARANDAGDVVTGLSTISGGTLNVSGDIVVAFAGNNTLGRMNISGGTVNAGGAGERWVIVNQWDTSKGQLIVSGGTLNLSNNTDLRFSTGNSTGASVVTLSSGAITGWNGNLTGNSTSSVVDLNQAGGAAANNTFNLDGGTLTINQIITNNNNGTAAFNFNGGTLKAAGGSANFVDLGGASQVANVRNGGAVIDSNGFDVTLVQVLQHSTVNGDNAIDGGLTKLGSGKLQLSGNNTFTGGMTVSVGTVQVGNNSVATLGGGNYGGGDLQLGDAGL
jgi:autotransporter-associated beta strand protein